MRVELSTHVLGADVGAVQQHRATKNLELRKHNLSFSMRVVRTISNALPCDELLPASHRPVLLAAHDLTRV